MIEVSVSCMHATHSFIRLICVPSLHRSVQVSSVWSFFWLQRFVMRTILVYVDLSTQGLTTFHFMLHREKHFIAFVDVKGCFQSLLIHSLWHQSNLCTFPFSCSLEPVLHSWQEDPLGTQLPESYANSFRCEGCSWNKHRIMLIYKQNICLYLLFVLFI